MYCKTNADGLGSESFDTIVSIFVLAMFKFYKSHFFFFFLYLGGFSLKIGPKRYISLQYIKAHHIIMHLELREKKIHSI